MNKITKDNLMRNLKKYGKLIGKQASNGDINAQQNINTYKLYYTKQEQCALAILCSTLEDWIKKNNLEIL